MALGAGADLGVGSVFWSVVWFIVGEGWRSTLGAGDGLLFWVLVPVLSMVWLALVNWLWDDEILGACVIPLCLASHHFYKGV
jgi:hypothetical protein